LVAVGVAAAGRPQRAALVPAEAGRQPIAGAAAAAWVEMRLCTLAAILEVLAPLGAVGLPPPMVAGLA